MTGMWHWFLWWCQEVQASGNKENYIKCLVSTLHVQSNWMIIYNFPSNKPSYVFSHSLRDSFCKDPLLSTELIQLPLPPNWPVLMTVQNDWQSLSTFFCFLFFHKHEEVSLNLARIHWRIYWKSSAPCVTRMLFLLLEALISFDYKRC